MEEEVKSCVSGPYHIRRKLNFSTLQAGNVNSKERRRRLGANFRCTTGEAIGLSSFTSFGQGLRLYRFNI